MNAHQRAWTVLGLLLCLYSTIETAHSSDSWQTLDRQIGQALIAGHDVSALLTEARARQVEAPHTPLVRSAVPSVVSRSEAHLAAVLKALDSSKADSVQLADIARAYQPVQAAYLLLEDNVDRTLKTLAQHHLPAAYLAHAEQTHARVRQQQDALAQALAPCLATPIDTAQCLKHLAPAQALLQPTESDTAPILRSSSLPFHPAATAPQTPIAQPAITPAYEHSTAEAPQQIDSANSADAPLSPAVLNKAAELGHDYVRLYEYVHNSVQTDWYAGAARQPDDVLSGLRGNDVDQASLLIALYRASGVPARYVHGLIEQPITDIMASLGLTSRVQVSQALTRAGIAFTPVIQGGQLTAIQWVHTWVEVYVPYANYRGTTVDSSGAAWLPLMPAVKAYDSEAATDLMTAAGIHAESLAADYSATVQTRTPLALLRQRLKDYLSLNPTSKSYDQQRGFIRPQAQRFDLLPSSLPAKVVSVFNEEAVLSDHWQQHVELTLQAADHSRVFQYQTSARRLTNQRITLSWIPASVDDLRITRLYGGIDRVPLYLIKVRAQLKINGVVVAYGPEATVPGEQHQLQIHLTSPGGSDTIDHDVLSGGTDAIALYLPAPVATPATELASDDNDTEAARILAQLADRYARSWVTAEAELADWLHIALIYPRPSVSIVGNSYQVEAVLGQPHHLLWQGVAIDAASHTVSAVSRSGTDRSGDWMRLASLEGSAQEQRLLADTLLVDAISADKGLALAREQQVPVHILNRDNAAELGPLTHPAAVKADIQHWLNQGYTVTVPESLISSSSWTGSVWRVEDPQTGAAGYFLSGGLAGGQSTTHPADWILVWLRDALMAAGLLHTSNGSPIAHIEKISVTDWQQGTVGKPLPEDLSVMVTNTEGEPVQDAAVTFVASSGGGTFNDDSQRRVVKTSVLGIASVKLTPGQKTSARPVFLKVNANDPMYTQAGLNEVNAFVNSPSASLWIEPFHALGVPDTAAKLNRKPFFVDNFEVFKTLNIGPEPLLMEVVDQYANPIANQNVSVSVGAPSYSCPHHDGATALSIELKDEHITSAQGTITFNVHTGNSFLTAYTATFTAGSLSAPVNFSSRGPCDSAGSKKIQVFSTLTADNAGHNRNFALPDHAVPYPIRYTAQLDDTLGTLDAGVCVSKGVVQTIDVNLNSESIQLSNGGAKESSTNSGKAVDATFRTGSVPGYHDTIFSAKVGYSGQLFNAPECELIAANYEAGPFHWPSSQIVSVLPQITGIGDLSDHALPYLPLTGVSPKLQLAEPVKVKFSIQPEDFSLQNVHLEFQDNGSVINTAATSTRQGQGDALIPRMDVDPSHVYQALVKVNDDALSSAPYVLPIHVSLFSEVNNQVYVGTEVDIVNHDSCNTGTDLAFTLSEKAAVTVTFQPRGSGLPIIYLHDERLEAGPHSYHLTVDDLPPGRYEVIIEGKRLRDNYVETAKPYGYALSEYTVLNSLPVGHPIVRGVDVFDGSFSTGSTDLSYTGRMPLELRRQYSSRASALPGAMGIGWVSNFDSKVTINRCGFVTVQGAEGGGARFIAQADGSFVAQKGYHGTLVGQDRQFDYYTVDGTQYHYRNYGWKGIDPAWVLEYIKDTNGNSISLAYEPNPLKYPKLLAVSSGSCQTSCRVSR